jgi:galactokinase
MDVVEAFAPGRVNLIGDHTDHTGGLCLPMASTRGITIRARRGGNTVSLRSEQADDPAVIDLDVDDPAAVRPDWARYVAGVVAELRPDSGLAGDLRSDLPVGAGLSSSAALTVAVALALGAPGDPVDVAIVCQRAEQRATGVPCGILDQLASTSGVEGHALLLDCTLRTTAAVALPDDLEFVVVHSGQERTLAGSAYATRQDECRRAEAVVGPLRSTELTELGVIRDPVLRRRARHVVSENARVRDTIAALAAGDAAVVGAIFSASHASLRDDFDCSTPTVDATVERLAATPGVHGARMTGGGWGGCVVAAAEPGALTEGWTVHAGGPARASWS